MDVSIIIVNYNTLNLTKACIDSIFEKTEGLEFEVILVDNASTDGSREIFLKDDRIVYVYNEENVGFGRANNIGYKHAKGDYLFLLNSDTYLLNNAIYLLWSAFRNNDACKQFACMGCVLYDCNNEITHSYSRFPLKFQTLLNYTLNPIFLKLGVIKKIPSTSNYNIDLLDKNNYVIVDYITGASLMIKKVIADKYGLFDEDFFMYYEETEMQNRYSKMGYKMAIIDEPKIVHLEGKSNRSLTPQRRTMMLKSYMLYQKKTSSLFVYSLYSNLFKFLYCLNYIFSFHFIEGEKKEKYKHLLKVLKL